MGQNSRFAQQPPRGWLRAAQHAILGAQHFWLQAKKNVVRLSFAVEKAFGALLFYFAGGNFFFFKLIYVYVVCNMETT